MNRNLIVVFPRLPEKHAATLREAAAKHGFTCRIFQTAQESLPYLNDAEVILGISTVLSQNAPNLKWICTPFAGVDPFMEPGAFANPDALLTNSSGAYGVTISEHVIMVILEILRRQREYQSHTDKKEWVRQLPIRSIHGSRITLLGTGNIGQETARRLRGFGPRRIIGVNRAGRNPDGLFDDVLKSDALDRILPETDILIISLPGTKETRRIVAGQQLGLMPDNALVINVGRGSVVDQSALEKELREGRLYAALDVFEREPIPPEDPIWNCPRLIITPHVSGDLTLPYTVDRIIEMFAEDFDNYCCGRPLRRLVDRGAGY